MQFMNPVIWFVDNLRIPFREIYDNKVASVVQYNIYFIEPSNFKVFIIKFW